jgi:two-component system LytT family sensor kinase
MEFDNDRLRKPAYKIELFYWALLILINPLVNGALLFLSDLKIWALLLLVNLLVFPAYLLYARIMGLFLFRKRYLFFALVSLLFFLVVQAFLFAVYSLILKFTLSAPEQSYFTYNYATITRECLWGIINTALAIAIFFIKKALEENDTLLTVQRDNTSIKLKYLRAQLSPHFLFNTLNSIYSLSLQKSDNAPDAVVKLADLMRYLIYECNEEKVPLEKEIEFIRNYIAIEKIRYKADIRFSVEGDTGGLMIEPFLFLPFIENGFKYALDNSFTEPFIYISIKAGPEKIVLNVINTTDIDLETQAKRMIKKNFINSKSILEILYPESYALDIIQTEKIQRKESKVRFKNAQERLEKLYPDTHTLDVILSNHVFTVSLIIKPVMA